LYGQDFSRRSGDLGTRFPEYLANKHVGFAMVFGKTPDMSAYSRFAMG